MMRRLSLTFAGAIACLALVVPAAQAHFLWVNVPEAKDGASPAAAVYFNESAAPGSARLATKIASTKGWLRTPGGAAVPLDLKVVTNDEVGHLAAAVNAAGPYVVDAHYEYGIFRHDGEPILLDYSAQHNGARSAADISALAATENVPLVIVPRADAQGWSLEVLWQGKPAADCEVVVNGPGIEDEQFQTDEHGRVRLKTAPAGDYALRARKVEKRSGEKNGESYQAVHHYATSTVTLPATTMTAATGTTSGATTANEVLAAARDARAIWDDFPGFSADVALRQGQDNRRGRISVSSAGDVQLVGFDGINTDRVQQILESFMQHRMAGGGPVGGVTFVEENSEHPLGRMIRFDEDKEMHSAYRVENNVVTEVNRQMGPLKFTISVLDVYRNPEGKYLPTTYNVSFWSKDTGELRASETHLNHYLNVDNFDLPQRIVVLRAENGKREVVSLEFTNHKLDK